MYYRTCLTASESLPPSNANHVLTDKHREAEAFRRA